jgi:hypothetical protein
LAKEVDQLGNKHARHGVPFDDTAYCQSQHFARAGLRNIALHDLKWELQRPGNGGSDLH